MQIIHVLRTASLLKFRWGGGAVVCGMPILDFRAVGRIYVGAVKTPADNFGGINLGAAAFAVWLSLTPPVSGKLDLDHTFG
jgi:hypothetical protein